MGYGKGTNRRVKREVEVEKCWDKETYRLRDKPL